MFLFVVMTLMVCQCSGVAITDPEFRVEPVVRQHDDVKRYRVGVVLAERPTPFTFAEVIKLSGLKRHRAVTEDDLHHARDLVRRAYLDRGYLQANISVEPLGTHEMPAPSLPYVDLVIRIKEGGVFAVRRLEFVGNENTRDRIIRRRVSLQEGEAYRQKLVDESLKRINRLGRFEELKMENVSLETNERERFVDVLIHFKEKPQRSLKKR